MSKLPTPELISSVTDVNDLRNACLTLLRVAEKERESKKKYRTSATLLKQELDSVKLELRCLEEKNDALVECIQNNQNNLDSQNGTNENQKENLLEINNSNELQNTINTLELQIEEMKKQQEINVNKINTLNSNNLTLEQEKDLLETKLNKAETTIQSLNQQIQNLQTENISLQSEKETYDIKINNYEEKVTLLQAHLTQLKKTAQADSNLEEQLNSLTEENAKLSTKVSQMENLQIENVELKEKHKMEITKLSEENQSLLQKVDQLETQSKLNEISIKTAQLESQSDLELLKSENSKFKEEIEKLKSLNEEITQKVTDYEQKINEYELQNLQLSNDQKALVSITESNKVKAKERILKLKLANQQLEDSHKAEIENITAENEQKIHELQDQINTLQDEKNDLVEAHKEKVNKMKTQKKNLKSKIDLLKQENDKLKENINTLEISLHDSNAQSEVMVQRISEFEKSKDNNISLEKTNSSLNSTIQKMNIEIFELKEKLKSEEDLQAAVVDREKKITKLKEQIQMFIKADKEKTEKMRKMQDELCEMTEKIGVLSSSQGNLNAIDQLAKVEREKADLEKKIENSEASKQMIKKNQKLNEIIEKSNKLYIQLKDENEQLKRQLLKYQKSIQLSYAFNVICDILTVTNNSNGNNEKTESKTREVKIPKSEVANHSAVEEKIKKKKSREEKKLAQTAYLRRVLLQFFTEEEKNRSSLIPIILKLVGCNDEQVSAAMRQWERSSHLISGFFGF
ncbi:hypothetical protein M9Y10_045987 [Tritrichomonas musculus]|uniref:GRIP domain-containing protein n=1 Tax=Tritrichomonas musculus TaxID=1915356 RepID=A0ABR2JYK5_9EUKA